MHLQCLEVKQAKGQLVLEGHNMLHRPHKVKSISAGSKHADILIIGLIQQPSWLWALLIIYVKWRFGQRSEQFALDETPSVRMTVCRGHWLCHYKWRENFLSDFIAGCTMAIIQIPQGNCNHIDFLKILARVPFCKKIVFHFLMVLKCWIGMAYALLANCQPVVGIYTSIFPVLVYSLLGPSPNASKGKHSATISTPY